MSGKLRCNRCGVKTVPNTSWMCKCGTFTGDEPEKLDFSSTEEEVTFPPVYLLNGTQAVISVNRVTGVLNYEVWQRNEIQMPMGVKGNAD